MPTETGMAPERLLPEVSRARFEELVGAALAAKDCNLALAVCLGGVCGMREAEAHHLRWSDFRYLYYRVTGHGPYMRIPVPCAHKPTYGIWPPRLCVYVSEEDRQLLLRLANLVAPRSPRWADGPVFLHPSGQPWKKPILRNHWKRLVRRERIRWMPFSVLRSYFAINQNVRPAPNWWKKSHAHWVARQMRMAEAWREENQRRAIRRPWRNPNWNKRRT